jgi:hypothetical protein
MVLLFLGEYAGYNQTKIRSEMFIDEKQASELVNNTFKLLILKNSLK